jgi:hypothetical protein
MKIKKNEVGEACTWHMWERRGSYRVLVGKPEEQRLLGRPRHRWDGGMDWIELPQDRGRWQALTNVLMNLQVP